MAKAHSRGVIFYATISNGEGWRKAAVPLVALTIGVQGVELAFTTFPLTPIGDIVGLLLLTERIGYQWNIRIYLAVQCPLCGWKEERQ